MSQLCKSVDKDTSCHPQMRGNQLGYTGTTQKPPRLNPTMNTSITVHNTASFTSSWIEIQDSRGC